MTLLEKKLPLLSLVFFACLIVSMGISSLNITPTSMFVVSAIMFFTCWANAAHLFGIKESAVLIAIAIVVGFFAELVGTQTGWIFGGYQFTDVLSPQILAIPIVIPFMWFNLVYIAYIMANLIIWRNPVDSSPSLWNHLLMSFFAAMLVTAYDLAADPYMVYIIKAWVMTKTDGWWFGQTLHVFFGWLGVSFLISLLFRLFLVRCKPKVPKTFSVWHALVPVFIYTCWMVFQMMYGYPVETRTISAFAMGIPIICVLAGMQNWNWLQKN